MDSKVIAILLVEDNPTDALLLRVALEESRSIRFELTHSERLGEALQNLREHQFDVVVLDLGLPDSSGLGSLSAIREIDHEAPILLLTGVDDEQTALSALQQGAQDYLVKGKTDGPVIARAIRYAIERKRTEELQRANAAKDQFLAILSHELRTPLTPVLTTISMLEKDSRLPEDVRQDITVIRRNVELEARLIDDLLDVTRIARGKVELNFQPVLLSEVIDRAVRVCQADIQARKLHFDVDMGPDAPYVINADAGRLQQVFWNLLKNAIKFTPHDGCLGIRCYLEGLEPRGEGIEKTAGAAEPALAPAPLTSFVTVEINDSGEGIAPEILPHIFNAFEQGGTKITRQFGGLGLGLTISRGLVEMHGGIISAHSQGKGKGATFLVKLPVAKGPVPACAPKLTPAMPRSATPLRILLTEDHGDTSRIMKRLLSAQGYEVQTAGDMTTALEMATPNAFDLLISDLGLPDGSGIDLLRELRKRGNNIPAIALSGYGQEEDMRRSREVGFSNHLIKPITPDRLTEVIVAVTGR